MTLKTRNSLTKYFFFFSLLVIAIVSAIFITAVVTKSVIPPESLRIFQLPDDFVLTQYNFTATMLSAALLTLYVPFSLLLLLQYFENTQSTEVIFFCGVLIGCLCESARVVIPLFGIWQSYSPVLFFTGRIIFSGRLMVPLYFFAAATLSESEQRHNVERNFTIMLALAAVISTAMPMNTAQTTTTCTPVEGFSSIATVIRMLIFIIAGGAFFINAKKHDSPELRSLSIFYTITTAGYLILTVTDNFLLLGIGAVLLGFGTPNYLLNLHRLYMWK